MILSIKNLHKEFPKEDGEMVAIDEFNIGCQGGRVRVYSGTFRMRQDHLATHDRRVGISDLRRTLC